ncbi:MAG: DUF2513 domain-containing protein [Marinobacter sp.]|nr:DUF2513 domain-containing protein [Marinobacter sp.]
MKRDFELVRGILKAVADKDITDSDELADELGETPARLNYHLHLMADDARLLTAASQGMSLGGEKRPPDYTGIAITWQGNDFLDAVDDEKAWKKIRAALKTGARTATLEALKTVAKGAGAAGLAVIFAKSDADLKACDPGQLMAEVTKQTL